MMSIGPCVTEPSGYQGLSMRDEPAVPDGFAGRRLNRLHAVKVPRLDLGAMHRARKPLTDSTPIPSQQPLPPTRTSSPPPQVGLLRAVFRGAERATRRPTAASRHLRDSHTGLYC